MPAHASTGTYNTLVYRSTRYGRRMVWEAIQAIITSKPNGVVDLNRSRTSNPVNTYSNTISHKQRRVINTHQSRCQKQVADHSSTGREL